MFTLIPFGAVIAEAFTGMADGTFAGLENFILVVHNAAFRLGGEEIPCVLWRSAFPF